MNPLALRIARYFSLVFFSLCLVTPAAALTININDLTEKLVVTSDGANTTIQIDNQPGQVEIARIFDPAFNNLPTGKAVFLIEPGAVPDANGLTLTSDAIDLSLTDATGAKGLLFNSDPDPGGHSVNCTLAQFVCIPETGSPQDVAGLLFGPNSGVVINIASDVPEPGTAMLLTAGLLALGASALRKLRG